MNLKCGQVILVEGKKYSVRNYIEYTEASWRWKEYEIVDSLTKEVKWLCVEEARDGVIEYSIYSTYNGRISSSAITLDYGGEEYRLYDQGTAKVSGYIGNNTDVDLGETYDYKDYLTEDEEKVISYENWGGEIEKSVGYYIEPSDVVVTDEIDSSCAKSQPSISTLMLMLYAFAPFVFFIVVMIMQGILYLNTFVLKVSGTQIKNFCDKSTSYTYVTSVSNTMNKTKARVYKSRFYTLDTCAKDIIGVFPEDITKVHELSTKDGISIETKNEYAYLYKEDGKVFVQVSPKSFIANEGSSTYHSSHSRGYHSAYRHRSYSPNYYSYVRSARQESINRRRASGGGTSSGK